MGDVLASQSIFLNLVVAAILGALIGVERQLRSQHTGLVTHALVALGAAAYTSLPTALGLVHDLRMSGQVVTGIGFLGAGLIIRDGSAIKGLSTSATIWATGAIGVFIGYGFIFLAAETTMLVVAFNLSLGWISRYFERFSLTPQAVKVYYALKARCAIEEEATLRAVLINAMNQHKISVRSMGSHLVEGSNEMEVEAVTIGTPDGGAAVEKLLNSLSLKAKVHSTNWARVEDDFG